jgi:ribonucleoside-diphosphate reductase alpha chain
LEQPLAKHSACNLCSINLSEYVLNPFTKKVTFDYDSLFNDVHSIVKAMDDIIDENINNHALPEQKDQVLKYRNIGIGVMGIHDMFIKFGFRYGGSVSRDLLTHIMETLFRSAVIASVKLGIERGSFPGYDPKVWDSKILKTAFSRAEIEEFKTQTNCLRNCSLLSVAPCGSIGTMLNVSTGIEPWFSTHYTRNTKSLNGGQDQSYEVWAPVVKEAIERNWYPETIVTAGEVNSNDRIAIQALVQTYCDTAISSTLNLPKGTTPQDIKNIYFDAWKKGLKGVTVYVDGSRDPILSTDSTPTQTEVDNSKDNQFNTISPISRKTFGTTYGATHCKKCACGTLYITTNMDKDGNLVEVFTHTSKGGICQANLNAVTRMISLSLRSGVKIDEIEDQLKAIHCPACQMAKAKGHQIDGMSCPDIMSRTIKEFVSGDLHICKQKQGEKEKEREINTSSKCPECGESIINTGGCIQCTNCGWSKCN